MSYITIIKTLLVLLPSIIDAVKAVEAAFPGSGYGMAKLSVVRSAIESAYDVISDSTVSFDQLWPAVSGIIGKFVAVANSTGLFKK